MYNILIGNTSRLCMLDYYHTYSHIIAAVW